MKKGIIGIAALIVSLTSCDKTELNGSQSSYSPPTEVTFQSYNTTWYMFDVIKNGNAVYNGANTANATHTVTLYKTGDVAKIVAGWSPMGGPNFNYNAKAKVKIYVDGQLVNTLEVGYNTSNSWSYTKR